MERGGGPIPPITEWDSIQLHYTAQFLYNKDICVAKREHSQALLSRMHICSIFPGSLFCG